MAIAVHADSSLWPDWADSSLPGSRTAEVFAGAKTSRDAGRLRCRQRPEGRQPGPRHPAARRRATNEDWGGGLGDVLVAPQRRGYVGGGVGESTGSEEAGMDKQHRRATRWMAGVIGAACIFARRQARQDCDIAGTWETS